MTLSRVGACAADLEAAVARHNQYTAARSRRGIYRDDGLHLAVLRLAVSLMLTPGGRLDPAYTDKLPLLRRMQNVPHTLYHHLSHRECAMEYITMHPSLRDWDPYSVLTSSSCSRFAA